MGIGISIRPQLQTGCAQPYIAIPVQLLPADWKQLKILIDELTNWLNHQSVKIAGPLFYRYHTYGVANTIRGIEVGYPVAGEVKGNNRIVTSKIPEGVFATLIHCGQPGVNGNTTLEHLLCWANQQNIRWKCELQNGGQVWTGFFEFYLTNPADVSHLNQCRTALALLIDE